MEMILMAVAFCLCFSLMAHNHRRRLALAWQAVVIGLLVALLVQPLATRAQEASAGPEIALENLDDVVGNVKWNMLFPDRLVFNRIDCNPESPDPADPTKKLCGDNVDPNTDVTYGVHDQATIRIKNPGTQPLQITSLSVSSASDWEIVAGNGAATVPVNGERDVTLRFKTQYQYGSACQTKCVRQGTLTINSNATNAPAQPVQLAGYWQRYSESNQEPTVAQIAQVFGFTTNIPASVYNYGQVERLSGEEIIAPYWQRADPVQPVRVRQIAAYHGNPGAETFKWYDQDSSTTQSVFTHNSAFGQSMLPPKSGATDPAAGEFTPTTVTNPTGRFGFRIGSEWSDPTRNNHNYDQQTGDNPPPAPPERRCAVNRLCGGHVRVWPVRDRQGNLVPNLYIVAQDYANSNSVVNYDFQDNVYLVSNITPAGATGTTQPPSALYRLDVGGFRYTDSTGAVWTSDNQYVIPSTVPSENPANTNMPNTYEIANTVDDALYRSYRGKTGTTASMTYALPVGSVTTVNVRLHFAERFWAQAGKRLFDVKIEGNTVLSNFDIFAEAGAKNKALIKEINNVTVTDGVLDLDFRASVDNASLAAIEVLCQGTCPVVSKPSAPTNLNATPVAGAIQLDWANNPAAENVTGYNVYRSTASGGPFTKVTATPVASSAYDDENVVDGTRYFYRVKAVNQAGESDGYAADDATALVQPPVAPTGLTAALTGTNITLSWNANNTENDLAGYNVYRSSTGSPGSFVNIGTVNAGDTEFIDTGAPEGKLYYQITAFDTANNQSPPSNTVNVNGPNMSPPARPTGATAKLVRGGVLLDWADNSESDLAGYNVYRSVSVAGPYEKLTATPLTTSTFTDAAVPASAGVYYQIRAVDAAGNESASLTLQLQRAWLPLSAR